MSGVDLTAQKSKLRKQCIRWRDELSKEDQQIKSAEICRRLQQVLTDIVVHKSEPSAKQLTVLSYLPFRSEVDVLPFLDWCWEQEHQVVVPRVAVQDKSMSLHRIAGLHETVLGSYGIREPHVDQPAIDIAKIDMLIMPGLAFDEEGNRLGYGGGYYDRLLARATEEAVCLPLLVAPCFELQIVENVPTDAQDYRMDVLVTEQRIHVISQT